MNKKAWFASLGVLAWLGCLGCGVHPGPESAPSADQERARIEALVTRQQAAWNQGDVAGFMEGYWNSPELSFSGSSGTTRGWQAVRDRYQKKYPGKDAMGQLYFSDLEIRPLGPDAALVLGRWELRRASGDLGGVFSLVLRRFPEGWRIIHDHTSLVPG